MNTPNTPAELAALNNDTLDTLNAEAVLEALLSLKAPEAKSVLVEALTKLRDFHSNVAHEAVEEGRENWFVWTCDASKLNTALELLNSVELD